MGLVLKFDEMWPTSSDVVVAAGSSVKIYETWSMDVAEG